MTTSIDSSCFFTSRSSSRPLMSGMRMSVMSASNSSDFWIPSASANGAIWLRPPPPRPRRFFQQDEDGTFVVDDQDLGGFHVFSNFSTFGCRTDTESPGRMGAPGCVGGPGMLAWHLTFQEETPQWPTPPST